MVRERVKVVDRRRWQSAMTPPIDNVESERQILSRSLRSYQNRKISKELLDIFQCMSLVNRPIDIYKIKILIKKPFTTNFLGSPSVIKGEMYSVRRGRY